MTGIIAYKDDDLARLLGRVRPTVSHLEIFQMLTPVDIVGGMSDRPLYARSVVWTPGTLSATCAELTHEEEFTLMVQEAAVSGQIAVLEYVPSHRLNDDRIGPKLRYATL